MRELGPGLWVVTTPLRFLGMQVGRNMAVVRLADGGLFVNSPAELSPELRSSLAELGEPRFVAAASSLHGHRFMEQYVAAWPGVELLAPPGLRKRRKDLSFGADLGDAPDPRWAADLDQALLAAHRFTPEAVLVHRASRTLIVGDLLWNPGPEMGRGARLWAGRRGAPGPTPAFRMAIRDRAGARATIDRVLGWDFDRIVVGHGEVVESGGREALRAAYSFLD